MTDLITHLKSAFEQAEQGLSKITHDIIAMEGMTGTKTRHFYNNLLNRTDIRYLEIGTWKGSSVCSAMYGNRATVTCIDNWSEFEGPKNIFLGNLHKYTGENTTTYIENDCFAIDVATLPTYNVFLYDGDHSKNAHYKALTHYYNCLDDIFIYVVDDWNWKDVRDGTMESITDLGLEIIYEKEIRLTSDNSVTPEPLLSTGWWNGIYAAILQKKK